MQELQSLKEIFQNKLFKIPDYQRGYAWSIKNLREFWEDTVNLPKDKYHYTGLLSLKKVDEKIYSNWNDDLWLIQDQGYKPFHVVDGQQRLTTFVIFIQCITELIQSLHVNKDILDENIYLGTTSLKAIKEEYLLIKRPPHFIIKTHKFSYEIDNPSFQFLRYRIYNEENSGTIQETFYTLNLENAKKFFKESLEVFYNTYGLKEIEILYKKLTQNLMFNVYEISDDFDVFVAFETMNNRGKKLSNLELLKNRLIYLTTLYDADELKDDERNSLRETINTAWKEVYYQLGRNKKQPLNDDDFLAAHWIMYFQYTREKGDDYIRYLLEQKFTPQSIYDKREIHVSTLEEFEELKYSEESEQEDVNNDLEEPQIKLESKLSPKEIEEYVLSLQAAAVHWYNTFNPTTCNDLTQEERLWIDRLNRIGIIYFRPLVAASFLAPDVNSDDRIKLFREIERFIFIAFRLGRSMSSYRNSEFYRASRMIRNQELTVDQIISALRERMGFSFVQYEGDDFWYFDHTHFQKHIDKKFKSGNQGGFYGWNGLRYFLFEYEMEKVRLRGSQKIEWKLFVKGEKDKISIEHIYPQTPSQEDWGGLFEEQEDKNLKFLKGTLGNLLPLSQSINSSLQNDSFTNKKMAKYNDKNEKIRQGYNDGSHSEIEVSNDYEVWDAESILDRGFKLIKFMEKRWEIKFYDDQDKAELLFLKFLLTTDQD